jgi:excisionase family DNA binding protein
VDEATAALGISRSKVYQYLRTGRLPSVTLGRRRLIRSDDLCAFVAELGA